MRKLLCFMMALLLAGEAKAESACTFPDPGELIGQSAQLVQADYAFSADYVCDAYQWTFPDGWEADRLGLVVASVAEAIGGWVAQPGVIEGYDGYILTGQNDKTAMLVPSFGGHMLLLVPPGCELVPVSHATPEPTPVPTPTPETTKKPAQTVHNDQNVVIDTGHWEWVTKEVDCPSCVGGTCSICHGTGTYRIYGQSVSCDRYCSACGGKGTYTRQEYVYVP